MRMPKFTADSSIWESVSHYLPTTRFGKKENMETVVPQMRGSFNCSGSARSRRQCEAWCHVLGGGMSSEFDGSITCTIE